MNWLKARMWVLNLIFVVWALGYFMSHVAAAYYQWLLAGGVR